MLSRAASRLHPSPLQWTKLTRLERCLKVYFAGRVLKPSVSQATFTTLAPQTYLEDPIWDKLQQSTEYTILFRDSSVILPSQEQLEGCPIYHVPLTVHVPMNPEEIVPEGAFAGVPRLRHVSVESGIRLIGAEAWQNCRQLRIVKLPATVVGISDNAFRYCKLLSSVSAPGCREFGHKAFAECCSLQWVYALDGVANWFSSETSGITSFKDAST